MEQIVNNQVGPRPQEGQSGVSQGPWSCPGCGAMNTGGDGFCKKCGAAKSPSVNPVSNPAASTQGIEFSEPPKKSRKMLWFFVILVLFGILALGGYFFWQYQQKKVAMEYVTSEGQSFSQSVSNINELSTEEDFKDKDDNNELYLKKLEEEKVKSEKAHSGIKSAGEINKAAVTNKIVEGLDVIVKRFYEDGGSNTKTYDTYIGYKTEVIGAIITSTKEFDKFQQTFRTVVSLEDAVNALKGYEKLVADDISRWEAISVPSGLEESHQMEIDRMKNLEGILADYRRAIETENLDQLISADAAFTEFLEGEEAFFKKVTQLREFYFSELHEEFVDLRKNADNVKTEITKLGIELGSPVAQIGIEGW